MMVGMPELGGSATAPHGSCSHRPSQRSPEGGVNLCKPSDSQRGALSCHAWPRGFPKGTFSQFVHDALDFAPPCFTEITPLSRNIQVQDDEGFVSQHVNSWAATKP